MRFVNNPVAATVIVTLLLALFGYFYGGTMPAAGV